MWTDMRGDMFDDKCTDKCKYKGAGKCKDVPAWPRGLDPMDTNSQSQHIKWLATASVMADRPI